ncbi:AraC family transcriptional regulator [Mesorhizobium argentiipisi]|uniref:AraC family transcriptional regulator n=1 Tax=Mesorhizobium argentiipisi TaxID=3015175 RepID=A0ABU8KAY6_9HYPH
MASQSIDCTTGSTWNSFADYFRAAAYSSFPQEHRTSPGRLRCRMVLAEFGPHSYDDPDVPDLVISSPLEIIKPGETSWNFGSGWSRGVWTPGSLFAMPPHHRSDWRADGVRRALLLIVPTETLRRVFGVSTPANLQEAFVPLSKDIWQDNLVHSLIVKLWEASERNRNTDYILADGLLTTLLSILLQRAATSDMPQKIVLSPFKLKRVSDFVDGNLDQSITVRDLATVSGLSGRHFARTFTQETGLSPHRWLMQRRISSATRLLVESDLDCGSIAEMCGFASQSHLSVAMKSHLGVTPIFYRRGNKPD